jgi:hypothetical protein
MLDPCQFPQSRTMLPPPDYSETVTSSRPFFAKYATVRFRQTDDTHFGDIKPPLGISTLGSRRLGDAWGSRLTICMVATRALTAARWRLPHSSGRSRGHSSIGQDMNMLLQATWSWGARRYPCRESFDRAMGVVRRVWCCCPVLFICPSPPVHVLVLLLF